MNLDFHDIAKLGEIATLLEVSAYPKPGNVHRTQDFENMSYEDFLISSVSIASFLEKAANRANDLYSDYPYKIGIGKIIYSCIESTNKLVNTNTNLGICMLLVPLSAAFGVMINDLSMDKLPLIMDNIIKKTSVDDAIYLTKAINLAQAGGLENKATKFDVNDDDIISNLKEDDVSMYQLLEMSSDYDKISYELTNKLPVVLGYGLPTFKKYDNKYPKNDVTLEVYLEILSSINDTLISRKYGEEISDKISLKAEHIKNNTQIATDERRREMEKFDKFLRKNKYNPGTTADFTAATLFVSLVDKYFTRGI